MQISQTISIAVLWAASSSGPPLIIRKTLTETMRTMEFFREMVSTFTVADRKENKAPLVSKRVKRGAEMLDEYGPEKWWDKIDVDTLSIMCPANCVLGQVYGSYGRGLKKLRLKNVSVAPTKQGLNTFSPYWPEQSFMLRDAWIEEVKRRRKLDDAEEMAEEALEESGRKLNPEPDRVRQFAIQ